MNRKIMSLLFIVTTVILLTVGCAPKKGDAEAIRIEEEQAIPVQVEQVSTGTIYNDFTYVSKLKPKEEQSVMSTVSGKVQKVNFDIGDSVQKGDVLFEVNGTAIQQQIVSAKQQLNTARISMNDAKDALDDMEELYGQGAVSEQQYTQAKSAYDQALAGYNTANDNYNLLLKDLEKQNVDTNGTLSNVTVRSPISGMISNRGIDVGDMLSSAVAPFTIVQMDQLLIEVGISETVVTKINTGDIVDIKVKAVSDKTIEGKVIAISPAADQQTGAYLTKIQVSNEEMNFKPGMIAEVSFRVDTQADTVIIPVNAVLTTLDGQYVFVVEEEQAKRVPVETGIDNGTQIQIIDGLQVGDSLIVEGQNYVEDGSSVKIVTE